MGPGAGGSLGLGGTTREARQKAAYHMRLAGLQGLGRDLAHQGTRPGDRNGCHMDHRGRRGRLGEEDSPLGGTGRVEENWAAVVGGQLCLVGCRLVATETVVPVAHALC